MQTIEMRDPEGFDQVSRKNGGMVDRHGVRPDPEPVEAVLTWKVPRTDTQLMRFCQLLP